MLMLCNPCSRSHHPINNNNNNNNTRKHLNEYPTTMRNTQQHHHLSHHLLNSRLDRLRVRTHNSLLNLSILEHDKSRHSANGELLSHIGDFVNVDFVVGDVGVEGFGVGEFEL